jgi:hypothetical protein
LVDRAGAGVGGVPVGQGGVGDRCQVVVAAFGVVDGVGVGQEPEPVGGGADGAEGVGGVAGVPARGACGFSGEDDAGLPAFVEGLVDAVGPPDGEQVDQVVVVDPDDVLGERVLVRARDGRAVEQGEV